MQKRVLIISGSPRKNGNSQLLCERFQEGAKASGHHVDLIQIAERQIGFCRACDGCMRNNGICVLYDDMAEILEIFQKADVLVLATPVYFLWCDSTDEMFYRQNISNLAKSWT